MLSTTAFALTGSRRITRRRRAEVKALNLPLAKRD
jgi:hypothetical protein